MHTTQKLESAYQALIKRMPQTDLDLRICERTNTMPDAGGTLKVNYLGEWSCGSQQPNKQLTAFEHVIHWSARAVPPSTALAA